MTLIRDVTIKLTSATALGTDLIPVGRATGTDDVAMTFDEFKAWIGTALDKIVEADSSVEVIDTGTGIIRFTLDNAPLFYVISSAIKPSTTNTMDIGTSSNKIKDIHIAGGIEIGSDAQGDIYFRDASGNFARLAAGAANTVLTSNGPGTNPSWTAGGGSGDSRWATWTATRTGDSTITSTTHLAKGTPIRFKATADSSYEYAIVVDRSSDVHTILGNICSTSLDDDFQYGVPELVQTETFVVPGTFADASITAGATAGLLYDDLLMGLHYIWNKSDAHLVKLSAVCTDADATVDPTILVRISADNSSYTSVFSAIDVDTTLRSTAAENVATSYDVGFGNYIDFSITKNGTGDAKNITVFLTFILE